RRSRPAQSRIHRAQPAPEDRAVAVSFSRRKPALEVVLRQPLRRPREPRLDDHLLQLVEADLAEPDEHRWVAVEVGGGEEDAGFVLEQRLLGAEMLDPCAEDRPVWRFIPERAEVGLAKRPLPHESFAMHPP